MQGSNVRRDIRAYKKDVLKFPNNPIADREEHPYVQKALLGPIDNPGILLTCNIEETIIIR